MSNREDASAWSERPMYEDLSVATWCSSAFLPLLLDTTSELTIDTLKAVFIGMASDVMSQELLVRALAHNGVFARAARSHCRYDTLGRVQVENVGHVQMVCIGADGCDKAEMAEIIDDVHTGLESLNTSNMRLLWPQPRNVHDVNGSPDAYCVSAVDLSSSPTTADTDELTAFPYGFQSPFLFSRQLQAERERASNGFTIQAFYEPDITEDNGERMLTVVGDWMGQLRESTLKLKSKHAYGEVGPFSSVRCFRIQRKDHDGMSGQISIYVPRNSFTSPCYDSNGRNINEEPSHPFILRSMDFCDPTSALRNDTYFVGWQWGAPDLTGTLNGCLNNVLVDLRSMSTLGRIE
ncbi:MAG: hypothetical protein ABFD46_05105 [Armatimonadota bacterium]